MKIIESNINPVYAAFEAGDFVDFVIEHVSGKSLKVIRNGSVLVEQELPDFAAIEEPLILEGFGAELLQLSVFSRG